MHRRFWDWKVFRNFRFRKVFIFLNDLFSGFITGFPPTLNFNAFRIRDFKDWAFERQWTWLMKYLSTFFGGCSISAQIESSLLHVRTTSCIGGYKQECSSLTAPDNHIFDSPFDTFSILSSLPTANIYISRIPSIFLPTHHSTFISPWYNFRSHLVDVLPSSSFILTDQLLPLLPLPFFVDDTHHRSSRGTTQILSELLKCLTPTPFIREHHDSNFHFIDTHF